MKKTFSRNAAPYINKELSDAKAARNNGDHKAEFHFLERAHVIGQASTYFHVKVHLHMLFWAIRHHQFKEAAGQVLRIIGAAFLTQLGLIPVGNTGGANVSPFKPMPLDPEIRNIIKEINQAK